jgi:polyisoprenoid-binding protein YceI
MKLRLPALLVTAWLHPEPAGAVPITPGAATIGYSVFALGLFPVRGAFTDFQGDASVPAGQPGGCRVEVAVRVASLRMAEPGRTAQALGANMLDAPHYPTMRFAGACRGEMLDGTLTLHGVTRPFRLAIRREGGRILGSGSVKRYEFGVSGLPALLSPLVHINLSVALPASGL